MFDFQEEAETPPDTLALALAAAARRAFARGLLHGYRTEEEALYAVRGRIRFDEQIRRRFGIALPVEVRYDEFTDDIEENRLVKAAVARLGEMRLRSPQARRGLGWTAAMLENVSLAEYGPRDVPEVRFSRLNDHYRGVVGLSRLILRHSAFEARRGQVRATGFLMDMNTLFQEFVAAALRESLGVSERVFREKDIGSLDEEGKVNLRPDLTWWDGNTCTFVGDAKYKTVSENGVPSADLYQLLAYVTALDLAGRPAGLRGGCGGCGGCGELSRYATPANAWKSPRSTWAARFEDRAPASQVRGRQDQKTAQRGPRPSARRMTASRAKSPILDGDAANLRLPGVPPCPPPSSPETGR